MLTASLSAAREQARFASAELSALRDKLESCMAALGTMLGGGTVDVSTLEMKLQSLQTELDLMVVSNTELQNRAEQYKCGWISLVPVATM